MIANVSAHRRANAFAQALEEASAAQQPPATPAATAEQAAEADLLTLATVLGELPKPELDPQVKVEQRALLVAAMEQMFASGGAADPLVPEQRTGRGAHRATPLRKLRPRSRWSKGIAAGGLSIGVAAGAFSGVAAASSDALPGDSLYGLKRGMEDLKLNLADDDADRGRIYLDQASTRLSEARRLMERGRAGDLDHEQLSEVRRALSGMQHDVTEGHRLLHAAYAKDGSLGPIAALSSFASAHRDSWSKLRDKLPAQLTDVGDQVTSVFVAIDQEVEPLRSMLPAPKTKTHGRTDTSHQSETSHTARPAPASSAPAHGTAGSGAKPQPSAPGTKPNEGLLGGSTGGLLTPPSKSAPPTSGTTPAKPPVPDVTLPPLLPGLLPGLGIEGEDAPK
ncbi:DUF5667 domain-containing protein [Streptomyces sp. BPTC-684]|uniref:DUF5667 domain-containing protein n=1 Tax=Streptomyces sp. BPTC-684 TaxID=3043734 RepID=UPI0024B0BC98|nr:DUF5667 domain-containing protein [Streptomyces sp. BPTC-684]WHM37325.1 DUF5667 domain-containing protein [Streptomyces sp. BPTC-684]